MKKKLALYIAVILLIIIVATGYHFSFSIKFDCSNIETSIQEQLNRGYSTEYSYEIELYESVTLGTLTYKPIEIDEQLGYVLLEKGITGRYKIIRLSYGGDFRNGIVNIDHQNYLFLMGRNSDGELSEIEFTLDVNYQYTIDVPEERVFLVYTEVNNDLPIGPISLDKIKLYNDNRQDVTLEFDLSGGSIA